MRLELAHPANSSQVILLIALLPQTDQSGNCAHRVIRWQPVVSRSRYSTASGLAGNSRIIHAERPIRGVLNYARLSLNLRITATGAFTIIGTMVLFRGKDAFESNTFPSDPAKRISYSAESFPFLEHRPLFVQNCR